MLETPEAWPSAAQQAAAMEHMELSGIEHRPSGIKT